jgi:dUTP pyrophosphatase
MINVQFIKTDSKAQVPTYATAGSAAFDFYSPHNAQLTYGSPVVINTGLAVKIPDDHVLLVFSRSGHGFNHNVRLANSTGVIDSDYTGEIKIKMTMDFPSYTYTLPIKEGDRIAQGIVFPVSRVTFEEIDVLPKTQRGDGGLGSTGS